MFVFYAYNIETIKYIITMNIQQSAFYAVVVLQEIVLIPYTFGEEIYKRANDRYNNYTRKTWSMR